MSHESLKHSTVVGFALRLGPTDQIKMSSATDYNGYNEVRRKIVQKSNSSCTEYSIARVGPRLTDEKRSIIYSFRQTRKAWGR